MKAFLYYSVHSVLNQLKKLFKTWLFAMVAGLLLAAAIIGIASNFDDEVEEDPTPTQEVVEEESLFDEETKMQIVELGAGIVVVGMMVMIFINSEKNGLTIFLPADVPALFASPWSSANVMLFRTFASMGAYLFMTVYLMIEIPSLKEMLTISSSGAAGVIFAFGMTLIVALIINIYIYILSASSDWFKKYKDYLIYGLVAAAAIAFAVYYKAGSLDLLNAAFAFFNGSFSRFVPIWGWLKGIAMYAIEGNIGMFILETFLCILTLIGLLILIQHSKPDYYEEAMKRSEEVAALTEKMKSSKEIFAVYKTGNKSEKKQAKRDKLKRDGLNHGKGAVMYLLKQIYNRFRFAPLHFLTKTMQGYLFVTALCLVILNLVGVETFALEITMAALCGSVFLRSTGNPLKDDIGNIYFLMAPEQAGKKLLFSLLGGTVDCLLDLLPSVIVTVIATKGSLLTMLGWMAFAVTLDFYSTCCGTFISASLPENISMILKQIVQVFFIYFGLLPDILVVALVLANEGTVAEAVALSALVNIVVGFVFFEICIPYVEAHGGEYHFKGNDEVDLKKAKTDFSRIGFGLVTFFLTTFIVQSIIAVVLKKLGVEITTASISYYLVSFVPMYGCGLPAGLWVMRKVPEKKPQTNKPTFAMMTKCVLTGPFIMLVGSLIGNLLTMLCTSSTTDTNNIMNLLSDSSIPLQIIFVVLFAPFMEELLFRKIIIGKLRNYGEELALLVSALLFGLFHGNFSQMFYAAGLGVILGYIYLRTGSIKYSFMVHAGINLLHGVLPMYLIKDVDLNSLDNIVSLENIPNGLIAYLIYFVVVMILAVIGFVMFCRQKNKMKFNKAKQELPRGKRLKASLLSPGILVFFVTISAYMVYYYLG